MRNCSILGFSMIEVMVSLFILTFLLASFANVWLLCMRETQSAYYFSVATIQMQSMTERLRSLGEYDGLEDQVEQWNKENQVLLPNAFGEVSGRYPDYLVSLVWGKPLVNLKIAVQL